MSTSARWSNGLSNTEAKKRLEKYGLNQIVKPREVHFLAIVKEEIVEPMILLLFVVAVFYTIWGSLGDAITIYCVIFALVLAEVYNEYRAKKTISSLSKISSPKAKVLRNGKITDLETEEVVPGDALVLTPGARIAADSKVRQSVSLELDESTLTGESFPIEKKVGEDIYTGTLVVSGEGEAEVFATGRNTRISNISALAQEVRPPRTPLQIAMKSLVKTLVWVALIFSIGLPLLGFLRGVETDIRQIILTALALAFATIPEELPIIITMILGLGAYKLSKSKFWVKKLKAAEVLGDATVILTDKTGTITENKMHIAQVYPSTQESKILRMALGALTDISLSPLDIAIMDEAKKLRVKPPPGKVVRERSFGDSRKTKTLMREMKDGLDLYITGAPEEVLSLSKVDKKQFEEELTNEAAKGRRVIAVAQKSARPIEKVLSFQDLEKDFGVAGLISFEDPPREGAEETIEKARTAGVRVIMVTGDHPLTARSVAKEVGIPSEKVLTGEDLNKMSDEKLRKAVRDVSVFARATPEHKYRLVKALRKNKEVVAVTGDGVNDIIALKGADIGIAMGVRGTDAAKEAADAVLADDNFVTIGQGIFEGRKFYDNLRKGVRYYLSVKVALIMLFAFPVIFNTPFPFAPIQIILLELFMDLAASAGFVSEPSEKNIYVRPPRDPKQKFMNSSMIGGIAVSALSLFAAVGATYLYASWQNLSLIQTQTLAFSAWIIGHIMLAFVSRSEKEPIYRLGIFSNKTMIVWAVAALGTLAITLAIPAVGFYFKLTSLTFFQVLLVIAIPFVAIFWQEIGKLIVFRGKQGGEQKLVGK
jgi:Ca2+-transporting ATPase